MKKRTFYAEWAYALGLVILAFGTALMERADFGMSMVVAPAYILHLKLSGIFPFFSFGMAEYCLQLVLILGLSLAMGKLKRGYLFSFLTAVLYGFVLDLCLIPVALVPTEAMWVRFLLFLGGMLGCSVGVALLFHTYFAPEAYELVVKELAGKTGKGIAGVKTVYDLTSLSVSVALSFCFFGFGQFRGVYWGTLITALVNGRIIGWLSAWLDSAFQFRDKWPLRKLFEE